MITERELLNVTDRTLRPLQHGSVLAGIAVLLFSGSTASRPEGLGLTLGLIALGLALFVAAAFITQKWAVTYKGHVVRYENNPFLGEKLFVDGIFAAKGKLGFRSEAATGTGVNGSSRLSRVDFRLDRSALSVTTFEHDAARNRTLAYWLNRPPAERLAAVEFLRSQIIGPDAGLRRVLRVTERPSR